MSNTFFQPKIGSSLFQPPSSVQCGRCHVSVPKTAIELLDRCIDPLCPLNERLKEDRAARFRAEKSRERA